MKLYSLVLYNLSPIQQGIQARHSCVELGLRNSKEYLDRAKNHKTVIVLNGGTSETLRSHIAHLDIMTVDYATFQEPDLGGITTAVSFVASDSDDVCKYFTPLFRLA